MKTGRNLLVIVTVIVAVAVAGVAIYRILPNATSNPSSTPVTPPPPPPSNPPPPPSNPPFGGYQCRGTASCFSDTVAYIVDGDTLDVGTTRIRLALVNSPEDGYPGYQEAKDFTAQTCPVGTKALVDEDDGQTQGSYGRMVALVYCGSTNLNAALLQSGNAVLVPDYCAVSEFAQDPWTGCP